MLLGAEIRDDLLTPCRVPGHARTGPGDLMRFWKRIICVEMFFVASVKKCSYLHTIVVASLRKNSHG